MTAARILAELRARGATARPRGEHIIVSPRSALTGELRAAVQAHKPDILAELTRERREHVTSAVVAACRRLGSLHAWPDATCATLRARAPELAAAAKDAEHQVDAAALAFVAGEGGGLAQQPESNGFTPSPFVACHAAVSHDDRPCSV
jgi:hypothetical protein